MRKRKPIPRNDREPVATLEEARERLQQWIIKRFGSYAAFEDLSGMSHGTISDWKGRTLPNLDSLLVCRSLGLPLDWLATGKQHSSRETDLGILVDEFRPFLQRGAGVGENIGNQAFSHLIVSLTPEGMIEKAADGLKEDFSRAVEQVRVLEEHTRLLNWIGEQLHQIEERVKAATKEPGEHTDHVSVRELFSEFQRKLEEHLPEEFRRDSPKHREYLAAIASSRAKFVEDAVHNAREYGTAQEAFRALDKQSGENG